ncbi:MAG TPA: DUF1269 domain-containing protein [Acidimicrobiales bacterium]|nr:DUF1269 domain-containing protein [Acidimicrobiales bacterium]
MSDPRSLVVLGFDNQLAAQEMLTTLTRLSTEGTLLLQDAVFVTRSENGKVRVVQTTDPSTGQAAVGGAWWGLLFGVLMAVPVLGMAIGAGSAALLARMTDSGISDKFVKDLRASIEPGKVYLAVLFSHANPEKALDEMKRYSGLAEVITTNLSEDASARLHEALSSGTVKTDVSDEESTITE